MEENLIDIAKILKSYPSGTKLYSPICGECHLYWVVDEVRVNGVKVDGEIVVYDNNRSKYSFYKDGTQHPMGECLLFPSKNCRDWDAMRVTPGFNKGDFLKDSIGNIFICNEPVRMPLTYIGSSVCVLFNDGSCVINKWLWKDMPVYANEEEKQKLLAAIGEKGYIWDAEKLELRKKEPEFKPFDKVLVRDDIGGVWRLAQYEFKDKNKEIYMHSVVGGVYWRYCIPYEGNEHLLGTTENRE